MKFYFSVVFLSLISVFIHIWVSSFFIIFPEPVFYCVSFCTFLFNIRICRTVLYHFFPDHYFNVSESNDVDNE